MMAQAIRAILLASATGHPGRSALHQSCEPRQVLGAVPLGIADDGRRADNQQPSQVSIALLGDTAEPVLATGRMLLRRQHQRRGLEKPISQYRDRLS